VPDRIERLFAFVAEDESGEGLTGFWDPASGWMPMVAADEARVESLRQMAERIATESGKPIRLLRFDVRTEVETITPASFRCPRCGKVSVHPDDIRNRYCGACHDWTGARTGRGSCG
jgi:hypothetical protein